PFGGGGMGGMGGVREEPKDLDADVSVSVEEVFSGTKKRVSVRRSGRTSAAETLEVNIPRGVWPGQRVRVAGKGRHGGDLMLRVVVAPHPRYLVEGSDLVLRLEVAPSKAVLGGEVEVSTPEGSVRLKVPAGSQPGRRFRLRHRGLPAQGRERGDFYVQLEVRLPEHLSEEARAAWERLAALGG
ncbi:MAG: hypothetical protein RLZZ142_219, partial [Verrucomicrobiota bacterium]